MLADQIFEKTGLKYPDGTSHDVLLAPLRERLKPAKKFVFGAQAVQMATNVAMGKPSSIIAALPWARLPAQKTWIEFSNMEMRNAMTALGSTNPKPAAAEVEILRTGFLMWVEGGTLVMDYVHTDRTPEGQTVTDLAPVRLYFDLDPSLPVRETALTGRAEGDATGRVRHFLKMVSEDPVESAAFSSIFDRFTAKSHPDLAVVFASMSEIAGPEFVETSLRNQANDAYRMFWGLILPALILLNCRNAVDTEEVEPSAKLNKSRVAKGRAPLQSHSLVKMHLTAARQRRSSGGASSAVESSFVIGHFKVRKPSKPNPDGGVFWWSPHVRLGTGTPTIKPTIVTG